MKRKVRVTDEVSQEVHLAFTKLLGLSNFDVVTIRAASLIWDTRTILSTRRGCSWDE